MATRTVNFVITADTASAVAGIGGVNRAMQQLGPTAQSASASANTAFGRMAGVLGKAKSAIVGFVAAVAFAGVIRSIRLLLTEVIEFDLALTKVSKTVEFSSEGLIRFGEDMQRMSRGIPIAANELLGVAEVAGRLGVASGDLAEFTRVAAMLGVATELSAEEAATGLSRLFSITKEAPQNFERVGSVLAQLEDSFATTSKAILDTTLRFAGFGTVAKLTATEMLAISTAIGAVGVPAERGGTAIQKLIRALTLAVSTGQGLKAFAAAASGSMDESTESMERFRDAVGEGGAVEGIQQFLDGFRKLEPGQQQKVLEDLGLTAERVSALIITMAESSDILADSLAVARKEFEENQKLQDEAAKLSASLSGRIEMLKNTFRALAVDIGALVVPVLLKLMEAVSGVLNIFLDLPRPVRLFVEASLLIGGTVVVVNKLAAAYRALAASQALAAFTGKGGLASNFGSMAIAGGRAANSADKLGKSVTALGAASIGTNLGSLTRSLTQIAGKFGFLIPLTGKFVSALLKIGGVVGSLVLGLKSVFGLLDANARLTGQLTDETESLNSKLSEVATEGFGFLADKSRSTFNMMISKAKEVGSAIAEIGTIAAVEGINFFLPESLEFDDQAFRNIQSHLDAWVQTIKNARTEMRNAELVEEFNALRDSVSGMDPGDAIKRLTAGMDELGSTADITTDDIDDLSDEIEKLRESFRETVFPAATLNADIANLLGEFSKDQIITGMAEKILAAGDAAIVSGEGLHGYVGEWRELAEAEAQSQKVTQESIERLRELQNTMEANLHPFDEMVAGLMDFVEAGGNAQDWLKLYGDDLIEARNKQMGFKESIDESTASLREMQRSQGLIPVLTAPGELQGVLQAAKDATGETALEQRRLEEQAKATMEALNNQAGLGESNPVFNQNVRDAEEALLQMKMQIDDTENTVARLGATMSKQEIAAAYGDQIRQAAEAARQLGEKLGPATKEMDRFIKEQDRAIKIAEQWEEVWVEAMGNVVSSFARGVTDMIFEGERFSVALKSIFKNLAKSIVEILVGGAFQRVIKGFGNMLAGFGAGRGGFLGGLTRGLGSLLGGSPTGGGFLGAFGDFIPGGGLINMGASALGVGTAAATAGTFGIAPTGGAAQAIAGGAVGSSGGGFLGGAFSGGLLGGGIAGGLATAGITMGISLAIPFAIKGIQAIGPPKDQDKFVDQIQAPFDRAIESIVNDFRTAQASGDIQAMESAQQKYQEAYATFLQRANEWAMKGSEQALTVAQAMGSIRDGEERTLRTADEIIRESEENQARMAEIEAMLADESTNPLTKFRLLIERAVLEQASGPIGLAELAAVHLNEFEEALADVGGPSIDTDGDGIPDEVTTTTAPWVLLNDAAEMFLSASEKFEMSMDALLNRLGIEPLLGNTDEPMLLQGQEVTGDGAIAVAPTGVVVELTYTPTVTLNVTESVEARDLIPGIKEALQNNTQSLTTEVTLAVKRAWEAVQI